MKTEASHELRRMVAKHNQRLTDGLDNTERVYQFIASYYLEHKIGPTYHQIMEGTGITSTNLIAYHVAKLIRQGRLKCLGGARSLVPVGLEVTIDSAKAN